MEKTREKLISLLMEYAEKIVNNKATTEKDIENLPMIASVLEKLTHLDY